MSRPKLKMCKRDVEIELASVFKKKIAELTFQRGQKFLKTDPDGDSLFILLKNFEGVGEYSFEGHVKLVTSIDECYTKSSRWQVSGRIRVVENEDHSPRVTFIGPLSCREK